MIDLHMHSIFSDDGFYRPEELIKMCISNHLEYIALADHNTIAGQHAFLTKAKENHLYAIPAIEIDCVLNGVNLHVLGYGIDYQSNKYKEIESNIRKQIRSVSERRLDKLSRIGLKISEKEIVERINNPYWRESWTPELMAEIILEKNEYKNYAILEPYRETGIRANNPYVNFYWDFFSQGKICFVPMELPSAKDIIEIIHSTKGKAVIAHPGVNIQEKIELLYSLKELGIDGIEAYSSYHTKEQSEFYDGYARKNNLIITCGSDFHGRTKPTIQLGNHKLTNTTKINDMKKALFQE